MSIKFHVRAYRLLLALVFAFSLAGIFARQAQALTYTVSNLNDSGAGSLRQAILDANANSGVADTITFSVSGTITLGSELPWIQDDLTIDGSGQIITISGAGLYRVFYMNSGKFFTLNALNIQDGNSGSGNGGGISNESGTLTVANSTFSDNSGQWGGGIYSAGTLTVSNSTFSGNHASQGGAIFNDGFNGGGTLTITNSTFDRNSATYGGGLLNYDALAMVTSSTFSRNSATIADGGGGIYNDTGSLGLKNTILANSTSGGDCYSESPIGSDINNLIESNNGCGTPVSSADPKLSYLPLDYGGFTPTLTLLAGSPVIDAGDDAACAASPVDNLDQRGVPRPSGLHCDIGSYEMKQAKLIVRSDGAYDGYIWESFETSGVGLGVNATGTTFQLGDDALDRQYRAILSFDTSALPPDTIVSRVLLKIRRQSVVGTDPFTTHGSLTLDIRRTYFGTGFLLEVADFQGYQNRSDVGTFRTPPVNDWYVAVISSVATSNYLYINKIGTTQFRLRFTKDDNDDRSADYMKFFSGNHATLAARPVLIVDYYIPYASGDANEIR